jgi:hypothetical protein
VRQPIFGDWVIFVGKRAEQLERDWIVGGPKFMLAAPTSSSVPSLKSAIVVLEPQIQ